MIQMRKEQAAAIDIALLLLVVVAGVFLLVANGIWKKSYGYLRKEALDTAYGVDGMMRNRSETQEKIKHICIEIRKAGARRRKCAVAL